ncbi:MAG: DUF484 family protein [Deltaproteobacteria bacterium]|nr:DUF484 family protein [Deltaproteobacteria bacterium]
MNKKENIERINSKIAAGFEEVEKKLQEANNIASLFEILITEIEKKFEVPFVWLTLMDTVNTKTVIAAVRSSYILQERLNIIEPVFFRDIFSDGLKPVLVNKYLKPYYRLFPSNKKYFVKSMAMVPFKINGEIVGSWNNGDVSPNRYTPEMETNLLQKLAVSLSLRLTELISANK